MKKLSFKKYLKENNIITFYFSRKFYDYLEHYYDNYIEYCKNNNYEAENLNNDYAEAMAFKEIQEDTYKILNYEKSEVIEKNKNGERWSGAINLDTNEPIYGLNVPDWLEDEYKSFCDNITENDIDKGLIFIRTCNNSITKVLAFDDSTFTLEDGESIDLITENIREMEIGGFPPELCFIDDEGRFNYKAEYAINIGLGHNGYRANAERERAQKREEFLNDIAVKKRR